MIKRSIKIQLVMSSIFAVLFFYFSAQSVSANGWNFFAILYAIFCTFDIVRVIRLGYVYYKMKQSNK